MSLLCDDIHVLSPFAEIDKKDRNCLSGNYGLLGLYVFVFLYFVAAERNRGHTFPKSDSFHPKLLRPRISSTLKYSTILEWGLEGVNLRF